jgi:FKBP-type peptidyl-prolyl cis-trans isomerase 2
VALDFNHPFAGQPLTLFVRVRRVLPPAQEGSEVAA